MTTAQTRLAGRDEPASSLELQRARALGLARAGLGLGLLRPACAVVLVWGITGPLFGFSDAWQLVINTGTTIVTFLMVFLIQNTQNRDARAIHLKLDELIRSINAARNKLIDLENCTDEELDEVQREFEKLKERIAASGAAKPQQADRRVLPQS